MVWGSRYSLLYVFDFTIGLQLANLHKSKSWSPIDLWDKSREMLFFRAREVDVDTIDSML
jgi:hypothetical protein